MGLVEDMHIRYKKRGYKFGRYSNEQAKKDGVDRKWWFVKRVELDTVPFSKEISSISKESQLKWKRR